MGYNDQLTHVTEPFGVTLNFAYDADGNRTLVTDSFGGTQASYYDSDNDLTETTYSGQSEQIRINFTNNGDGMPTTITRYSDLAGTTLVATTDEGYDGDGNVTSIYSTNAGSTVLQNYSYSYNSKDQLTSQVENGVTTAFAYDSTGQLTGAGTSSYSYDANGNRTEGSDAVTTGNEMSADASWTYSYDKEGNLKEKISTSTSASWTYAYNASNELTEVTQFDSSGALEQTVHYSYDAFGEEIYQDVTPIGGIITSVTKFAYDGWNPNMPAGTGNANFMQWAVLNGDNSLQSRNINGNTPGQHLARVDQTGASDPSGVYYILNDRLNSVRDVVDTSGTVQDAINYDAYGNIQSGETNPNYRGWYAWTGQELDAQTDLQYNNARWYDATTGRWISQDPLGFDAGDSNLYRYVNNRPTYETDPSGLVEIGDVRTITEVVPGHIKGVVVRVEKTQKCVGYSYPLIDIGLLQYDVQWQTTNEKELDPNPRNAEEAKGKTVLTDIFGRFRGGRGQVHLLQHKAKAPFGTEFIAAPYRVVDFIPIPGVFSPSVNRWGDVPLPGHAPPGTANLEPVEIGVVAKINAENSAIYLKALEKATEVASAIGRGENIGGAMKDATSEFRTMIQKLGFPTEMK